MLRRLLIGLALIFLATTSFAQQGWFWQNPLPQGNSLYDVHFTDANTGWAVGAEGTVLHTTDGGSTWTTQISGTRNWLVDVHFTDATTGWAVGAWVTILHTTTGGSISIEEDDNSVGLPLKLSLVQNYPNPFNPISTISYALPEASKVKLEIYNVNGRIITTLIDGNRSAGIHTATFEAVNLASGIYIYKLRAGEFIATGKVMLMK